MTTYRLYAKNASGDTLFFKADADGADYLADLTAKQAFEVMTTRKSGHRWNDDTQRFTRNRIATFRLVHDSGHVETFTPAEAAAAIAPVVEVTPVTSTTAESLALLQGISAAQELAESRAAEPQYVTVNGRPETGLRWHLCDSSDQPVEAGEHITDTGLNFTLAATPDASCDRESGEPVRIAVTYSGSERLAWIKAEMLVTGWHWEAERV